MRTYGLRLLVVMVAVFIALTGSAFANPVNSNTSDRISFDVYGDGLVHAVIEKSSLAAQSTHKDIVFSSRKIIMSEIAAAAISPILNNNGIVRAQTVASIDGVTYLGSSVQP